MNISTNRTRAVFLALWGSLALAACGQSTTAPPAITPETVEAPAAPPPKPKITAAQLLGRSDTWVTTWLGAPHFKREDREAHIWQYKNGTCVLNLFLYAERADAPSPAHVLHFDARDLNGGNADRDRCLSLLQD